MENKAALILSIIAIVCGLVSTSIFVYRLIDDHSEEEKFEVLSKESPRHGLLIKEYPKACHMPRDCFESEEEYLDQFPGKEVPEILYECLIYCYNDN